MIIDQQNLSTLFTGYKSSFAKGFSGAKPAWNSVAMEVPSTTSKEVYAWLGQLPGMREWIGDRHIGNLSSKGFEITNLDFESTIAVPRNAIEDDQYGIYSPLVEEMGRAAACWPDELVFKTLALGFTQKCHDGQYFFDTDHPVGDGGEQPVVSVSNMTAGSGPAWYLLDTSRALRPLIFQKRRPPNLVKMDNETDPNVFYRKEYIYGVDARGNAGFGLWQLAFASKSDLNEANYSNARTAMQSFKGDSGRPLGVSPTVLVVPPQLEGAAFDLINSDTLANGQSNKWRGTVQVVVTPWAQ